MGWHSFAGAKPTPITKEIAKEEGIQQAKIRGNRAFQVLLLSELRRLTSPVVQANNMQEALLYYTKGIDILNAPKHLKAVLYSNRSEVIACVSLLTLNLHICIPCTIHHLSCRSTLG